MKYKAFISYRHSENGRRHAVALETALKRYAKPTLARPMKIFRDEKHMKPDISLPKLIREGLENSEYLIFLAERASAESQWCGEELEYWCGTLQRTDRLIIALIDDDILLDGTNGIYWDATTALPALLRPHLPSIPLYMDLRRAKTTADTDLQNPKYRHEINALTARLRGLNPEDLNDEEIRVFRRNIRLRNGAIGVLLGMLVAACGAAWWAMKQQGIAERQQKAAENMEILAKNEREAAEAARDKIVETFVIAKIIEAQKFQSNKDIYFPNLTSLSNIDDVVQSVLGLDHLELTRMGLTFIPPEIFNFRNLTWLDIEGNELTSIPDGLGYLINLEYLSFSRNKFSDLPIEVCDLVELQSLRLRHNQINTLPEEICNLTKLEDIDVSNNNLINLPVQVGRLKNLQSIGLSGNKLTSLPSQIGDLENLRVLELEGNQLDSIPQQITRLKNLQRLTLRGNPISAFQIDQLRSVMPWCEIKF